MTRPNIDMITASLRNCSLGRGRREPKPPPPLPRRQQRRHLVEGSDEIAGVTVELNSGTALPYNWEQYLDMRVRSLPPPPPSSTPLPVYPIIWPLMLIKMSIPSSKSFLDVARLTGEVYYINWETGIRTTEDPRSSTIASSYSDEDEASDDEGSGSSYDASGDTTGSSYDAGGDTPGSSSLSSASSTETSASVDHVGGGHVLVAAGCRACFTYFMVPKRAHVCPSCGGRLFHLGNNGSS
ncbi:hypothetical protein GW17_00006271 [Ensete ventricosum]|nr:hypothetical protein GW17_00006271 [Ensete ventricosum]